MSDLADSRQLSDLLSLTDAALSKLDLQDLLTEVLGRVRSILEADTAAVLLIEPGSDVLIARAAVGLEDEVRQGVTIPVGTGFAGAVAQRREPVYLSRVDASTVANPILWEKGVRVMLGTPLLRDDKLIGVLHVGRLEERPFVAADAELLQVAAERVTAATLASQFAVESAAARLLERSLQPTRLPSVPGLRMAGRYVPADNRTIGGDWYDAFVLASGVVWLVVGDVGGHGLNAAVIMGRVKSALRAYTLVAENPAAVLEMTDQKVRQFEIGTLITVACATSKPPYDTWEICIAGHPPPVLAAPGRDSRLLELPVGPPLGALPGVSRVPAAVELPPGGVLVLYTDGLVERRDEDIDVGLERLRATVTAGPPAVVCQAVTHTLIGPATTTDDIALLAIQRLPIAHD